MTRANASLVVKGGVMAILIAAGMLKLLSIDEFATSLVSWGIEAGYLRSALSLAVSLVEVTIGTAWLCGFARRHLEIACVGLLVTITALYIFLMISGKEPECNCFGAVFAYKQTSAIAPWIVCRNIVFCAILLYPKASQLPAKSHSHVMSIHASSPSFDRRGFTLLETLLVIALIGILVTLMLPMATRTKELASMAALTARLGSHAKVISSYAQDYRDYMPAFTDPKATYTVLYVEDEPVRLVYFDTYWSWHLVLAGLVYDSTHRDGMFYDQAASGLAPVTDILYSSSFGASPAFWRDTTRTGPDQWRAMRLGEVQFPSQKAVYLASGTWRESRYSLAPLAFCDGSAEALTMDEVAWGYPNGTGNWPGSGLTASIPGMVTIDGVLGRDR